LLATPAGTELCLGLEGTSNPGPGNLSRRSFSEGGSASRARKPFPEQLIENVENSFQGRPQIGSRISKIEAVDNTIFL